MSVALTPAAPTVSSGSASGPAPNLINPLESSGATSFQDAFQRRLGHPVSAGAVVLAPRARTLASFSGRTVGVWRLPESTSSDELSASVGGSNADGAGWEKALEMELRFRTNVTAGAVSADGRWLAVADAWETKLFRVEDVSRVSVLISWLNLLMARVVLEGQGNASSSSVKDAYFRSFCCAF